MPASASAGSLTWVRLDYIREDGATVLGREWSRRTLPVGSLTREQAAFVDAYNPMGTAVIGPVGTRALGLERSADVVGVVRPGDGGNAVTDAQRGAFAKAVADPSMDEQLSDENVRVERGFVDQYDRLRWLLVGTVVLLILVATTTATALSMGETQRDLATLAAIGSTERAAALDRRGAGGLARADRRARRAGRRRPARRPRGAHQPDPHPTVHLGDEDTMSIRGGLLALLADQPMYLAAALGVRGAHG